MSCSVPPPLTEDQLSTVLDGTADSSLLDHLAHCDECAARLEQARDLERSLYRQLQRWDCPSPQRLGDYHLGLLTGTAERAIVRHLAHCALCMAEIEDLRVFLTADESPRVAASAPRPATVRRPRLGELVARLLPRTPVPALRGNGNGPLMAEADGITILLDLQPVTPNELAISGQVVDDDQNVWTGALVEIRSTEALIATAHVDDLGSFRLDHVAAGKIELRITTPTGRSVILPDLDLAA